MTDDDPFLAVRDGARHRALSGLAAQGPVHTMTLASGAEAWVVTRQAEARALLTDPRVIKGGPSRAAFADALPPELHAAINTHMLSHDPPEHTRLRRLVSAAFTRRTIDGLAPRIERICAELLDAMAVRLDEDGEVDLIEAYAGPLPITVICELLGVPEDSRGDLRRWAEIKAAPGFAGLEVYQRAMGEMVEFVRGLLADKRRAPADDLLSALVAVRDGGDRLSEVELISMVNLLLVAGHETTVNFVANGMNALFAHPDQMALLRAEPERLPAAVEELLRYDPPVQTPVPMVATEPIELAGRTIPAGPPILVALLAVNRDPALFADPADLDVTRDGSGHLAFGHGIHYCLGAPLARLEGRIAVNALLERFDDLERAVPEESLERPPSLVINRLASLPVRRRAAATPG